MSVRSSFFVASIWALSVGTVTVGQPDRLLVGSGEVFSYDGLTGAYLGTLVGSEGGNGLVFGPDGNLYVSNPVTSNILRFDG